MIRIAVCVATDHTGGGERYLTRLHSELAATGHATSHLFGRVPGWAEAGLDSSVVGVGPKWRARRAFRAFRSARAERAAYVDAFERAHEANPFDVIHMQFKREQILLTKPLSKLCPVVWTEHAPLPTGRKGRLLAPLYRRGSAHADTVIAVSDRTRASVKAAVSRRVKTVAILSAVDTRRFRPASESQRREARSLLAVSTGSILAVSVCRLSPLKRVERTLDAVDGVVGLKLVVAGEGPSRAGLERQSAGKPVTFSGWLDDPRDLYRAADFAFINAEPLEGLLLSLLEAAASGCVIVGFAGGPVDEEIRAAGGILLAPDSKLSLEDVASTMHDRRATARQWAELHDYDKWVSDHLAVFESAASRSSPA